MALDWKSSSQWWYARLTDSGRKKLVNLGLKIEGRRPASINDSGPDVDRRFIESRGRALSAHDRIRDEVRSRTNLQEVQQKIIELKTGNRLEGVALASLPDKWERIPRKRKLSDSHKKQCRDVLGKFVLFMQERWPTVTDLTEVTREHVAAYMDSEATRGVSPRTWNVTLTLLRTAFRHLQPEADAFRRYLATIPLRDEETIFRKPYSPEELKAIEATAREDDFTRPLIVTAICTAMRKGDVCRLLWSDVDLKNRFITVKTSKTRETISLPIFPLLYEELRKRPRSGSEYVFPEQAAMYERNPDGIGFRVQKILSAVFNKSAAVNALYPELPPDETRQKGYAYIETLHNKAKAQRMRAVFDAYMDGTPWQTIMPEHGVSKASVSLYLNEIEANTGCRIIRIRHANQSVSRSSKTVLDNLTAERKTGLKRGVVRSFQSFRVTWVTLALTAGVPLEIVRKVTGHKTVEIVLKHYFQPGREEYRQTLQAAMPQLMMNGGKTKDEQLRAIILRMRPRTMQRDKIKALALLDGSA